MKFSNSLLAGKGYSDFFKIFIPVEPCFTDTWLLPTGFFVPSYYIFSKFSLLLKYGHLVNKDTFYGLHSVHIIKVWLYWYIPNFPTDAMESNLCSVLLMSSIISIPTALLNLSPTKIEMKWTLSKIKIYFDLLISFRVMLISAGTLVITGLSVINKIHKLCTKVDWMVVKQTKKIYLIKGSWISFQYYFSCGLFYKNVNFENVLKKWAIKNAYMIGSLWLI